MPFVTSVRRALPAVSLLLALASAQTCWYPNGKTISSDVPCNGNATVSSCCSSQSYCLSGGGCFTGGIVTRGSCTDQSWDSPECAQFCKTFDTDGETPITGCSAGVSTNTFVCGLDNSQCSDTSKTFTISSDTALVLRPAQIAYLVGHAIASSTATPAASAGESTGTVIGVALGVAIPLLLAIAILSYLLFREKRKPSKRSSMYRLPDNETKESLTIHPPPSMINGLGRITSQSSNISRASSRAPSERGSFRTVNSMKTAGTGPSPRPSQIHIATEPAKPVAVHNPVHSYAESQRASHMASLAERIEGMKVTPQLVDVRDSSNHSRHELESSPSTPRSAPLDRYPSTPKEVERYELAASRLSR